MIKVKKGVVVLFRQRRTSHSLVLKVLKGFAKDKKIYWKKEDDLVLKKIKRKSIQDIKKMGMDYVKDGV